MNQCPDILIIGGGVVGLSTAWFLRESGVSVTVVDRQEIGRESSWAGAGIIPPADQGHARTPLDQLRAHSVRLYPLLSAALRERTGIDNGFVLCGGIELPDPDHPDLLLPTEEWHSHGVPFQQLDRQALLQYHADLALEFQHGVWLPGIAQVRNPWHLRALVAGCLSRGVTLLPGWPIERLITSEKRVIGALGPRGQLSPGQVLISSGAWSDQLLTQVGWTPGIRPIRGQIALLRTTETGIRPILLQGKRYLVPRTDGRILIGSTEEDVGFDTRTTAIAIADLLALAARIVPSLSHAPVETCWAGLRPGSVDGLPYLGNVPGWDNLHVAAGHFRAGLQLSAATGQIMAQHLLKIPTLVSLTAFRLDRPAAPDGIPVAAQSR